MENINFDTGIQSYRVGGGVLRFNPADPKLYTRFLDCLSDLEALEAAVSGEGDLLARIRTADTQAKAALSKVFPGADWEAIFQGVSLLAVGSNGESVLANFLAALEPVLRAGAMAAAKAEAAKL